MQQGVTHFWRTAGIKHFHLIDTLILQRNIWIYKCIYNRIKNASSQKGHSYSGQVGGMFERGKRKVKIGICDLGQEW